MVLVQAVQVTLDTDARGLARKTEQNRLFWRVFSAKQACYRALLLLLIRCSQIIVVDVSAEIPGPALGELLGRAVE